MDGTVAVIEKYKARLTPGNDFRKVFRALQKLNEIEMTEELLRVTGIGKAVNSCRKKEGLGDFAREIVNKWRRLINIETQVNETNKQRSPSKEYTPTVKSEPREYDPTQNWKMKKTSPYKPSVKQERVDDEEYDPSGNWQMSSSQSESGNEPYQPTTSPVEVQTEKISPSGIKKRKRRENGRRVNEKYLKPDPGIDRESAALETLQKTQKEHKRITKEKKRSKVKVEKASPERRSFLEPPTENGDVDAYDPQSNFELENSHPIYDHESSESDQGYDPSLRHESEEYDPGPSDPNVNYQPSSNSTYEPVSSRVNEQEGASDSEASYEEDEPGAYLLHPRRGSTDYNRRTSETSEGNTSQDISSSFVQSTTLYSRNKSVDSEDGAWGAKVNGVKVKQESSHSIDMVERSNDKKLSESSKKQPKPKVREKLKSEKVKKNIKEGNKEILQEKHKTNKRAEKSAKIKKESDSSFVKEHKKSGQNKKSSEKRKPNEEKGDEPVRKKSKSSKDKGETSKVKNIEVKDAGFLFEDIPDVSKTKKKKNKSKKSKISNINVNSKPSTKLDLHLPKIQTTYRPLPRSSGEPSEKRKSAEIQLTDNQAAELHSTRQTKKMLVYSGGGGGFIPKMMSLYDQCMGVLMNNIDAIDTFGGIPYDIVLPILKKCTPDQLYAIEDSNPYLLEDSDELWEKHSSQEFRGVKPEELESWREMYLRLSDEREAKLQNLTQMIQAKEAKKKPLEKKVLLAYVGANAKAPRQVRRAQVKYGTGVRSKTPSVPSTSRSLASAVRREIVDSRMSIPVGSITAASVDREDRMRQVKDAKKGARVAPMMAKTLRSIGKMRFKR